MIKKILGLRIFDDELIELEKDVFFKTDIIGNDELPYKIDVSYINKDFNYQISSTYAERSSINTKKKEKKRYVTALGLFLFSFSLFFF